MHYRLDTDSVRVKPIDDAVLSHRILPEPAICHIRSKGADLWKRADVLHSFQDAFEPNCRSFLGPRLKEGVDGFERIHGFRSPLKR